MGKKRQGREQFVPPKPLFVESDTTGDARPPSLAFMARHYRSEYDLEKIKLYNNHAKETCYNLPLEDVTEYFETPCVSEVVSSLKSGAQNASNNIQSIMTPKGVQLNNIYDITNTKNSNLTTNINKAGKISFNNGMTMTKNAITGVNNLNQINVSSNNLSNVGSISFQNGDTIPRVSKTIAISQPTTDNQWQSTTVPINLTTLKSGDLISFKGANNNFMPVYLSFKIPSDNSSFYFVANSTQTFFKTDSGDIPVRNGILYNLVIVQGKLYVFASEYASN